MIEQSTPPSYVVSSAAPPFDLLETDRLLSTTWSVRQRLDFTRSVERDVILSCLRIAVQAPTPGDSQRWRWLVITDAEKRAALAEIYRETGLDVLREKAETSEGQTRRVYESAVYLAENLHRAPAIVIPCVQGRIESATNSGAAALYGSIIPAAWSFMLALRSRGLGSTWTTIHLRRERDVADLHGIPEDVTQVALLPVAYTVGTVFQPAKRPPIEEITYWDDWLGVQ